MQFRNLNLYALFTFILIISANFLAPLFPCRFQYDLANNMALKHLFGFLTLTFFVVLATPDIRNVITNCVLLYVFYLFMTKTNYLFFIIIIVLLYVSFIVHIVQDKWDKKDDLGVLTKDNMNRLLDYLYYAIISLTFVGFLTYMGEKKIEYGSRFNYIDFLFGHPVCKEKSPKVPFRRAIMSAFK